MRCMELMGTPQRTFFILAIFGVSFAVGQNMSGANVLIFPKYASLEVPKWTSEIARLGPSDFMCFGEFHASPSYLILNFSKFELEGPTTVTGGCLYRNRVDLLEQPCRSLVSSFSTMIQFSMFGIYFLQGLAFIISGDDITEVKAGGYLGYLNSTNNNRKTSGHNFAVELNFYYDYSSRLSLKVIKDNRTINDSSTYLDSYVSRGPPVVWIEYDGGTQSLDITVGISGAKPKTPVLSTKVDLIGVVQESMLVGLLGLMTSNFSSTSVYISKWTFNANGPVPDYRRKSDGTIFDTWQEAAKKRKARIILILSVTIPAGGVFFILAYVIYTLHRRISQLNALAKKYQIDELEQLAGGPRSFKYKVLSVATKGFHSTHLLGTGGFGSVFKGKILGLPGTQSPTYVAIKRISATSHQGAREFLAEVKIIGQVQHRNLVRLLGWCHERGELLLVYDYMPNGSLDQHLFKNYKENNTSSTVCGSREDVLSWARRLKIISGVATALAYLHEEWEQRVIHRDVKSSNVMLDINFNARLGDFGLARLSDHAEAPPSTAVLAGTRGYLAPELGYTLKATEKTDVYSFGVLVLEVASGRRPLLPPDERRTPEQVLLVDWVWGLYKDGNVLEAADCRLEGAFDRGEMVTLLKIGLLCCHPDPDKRPSMRHVMNIWKGTTVFPPLPQSKPIPVFVHLDISNVSFETIVKSDAEMYSMLMTPMEGYAHSTPNELDYPEARDRFSDLGESLRFRPWKSTPLPM